MIINLVEIEHAFNKETLRTDTGYILAFEPQINFNIKSTGSLKSIAF
jgi:uncharacterized protein (AIM24 family)